MKEKLPLLKAYGTVLKTATTELYQSMGYMLLVSLIWFVATLPMTVIIFCFTVFAAQSLLKADQEAMTAVLPLFNTTMLIVAVWNTLVAGPATTALYGMHQVRKESYLEKKTFFEQFKKFYWSSFKVYGAFSFGLVLLILNFIITLIETSFLMKIVGLITFYLIVLVFLMSFYLSPLIYYKHKFTDVFRKAFLVMMDNFGLTLAVNLTIALIYVLSVPSVILLLFLYGAFYLWMTDSAFDLISERYETVDAEDAEEIEIQDSID